MSDIREVVDEVVESTRTEAQEWFEKTRKQCLEKNPMSMEEIDAVIHEENS